MVPKAPDKQGIVNLSSKRQVERLPVDDNDESDEDGSRPPSDEEEDVVDAVLYSPPPNPSGVRSDTRTVLGLCSDFLE